MADPPTQTNNNKFTIFYHSHCISALVQPGSAKIMQYNGPAMVSTTSRTIVVRFDILLIDIDSKMASPADLLGYFAEQVRVLLPDLCQQLSSLSTLYSRLAYELMKYYVIDLLFLFYQLYQIVHLHN